MGKINWGFKVKISTSRLKEIIREEVQKANEMTRLKEGWWEDLSDKAQKSYIKKHGSAPNSSGKKIGSHITKAIAKDKKGQDKRKKLNRDWDAKTSTASDIAKDMGGNMTGAVKKIEKIKKGLSDDPKVKAALRKANESIGEAAPQMRTKPGQKELKAITNKLEILKRVDIPSRHASKFKGAIKSAQKSISKIESIIRMSSTL